ncbi:MAG: phytanoyl-CoA dioxygenase family protein, partial [Polyangiaceae bacterium]
MSFNPRFIATFEHQSFVVLPHFLEPTERAVLRRAGDAALEWSRTHCVETSHSTPRISLLTQANSFEPGPVLLAPILAFASSARVCTQLQALHPSDAVGIPELKDAHYYHEQTQRDWDGDWHRDSQFARVDLDQERTLIANSWSLHFRVAFEDDERLEVVPGSHRRWDTAEELAIRRGSHRASNHMPNAERVCLRAGDACLFHAWSIHR